MYTNIPHEDGLDALYEELEKRDDKHVPSEFIVRMMEQVLNNNIFEK